MSERYVTEAQFERWALRFDEKLDEFIEKQHDRNEDANGRLIALETNQKHAGYIATWLSGLVAAIVAGLVLAWTKLTGN